jgi:hypothetical protein
VKVLSSKAMQTERLLRGQMQRGIQRGAANTKSMKY